MMITVFGATGGIGRHVVQQALDAGHDVTAFTRDAGRMATGRERLHVVQGDPTDPAQVLPAVKDAQAIVVALGAGRRGTVREAGTRAVVEAAGEAGVRRLVCLSTIGVGDSRANLTPFWKYVMFGALLRRAYADHVRQEELVRASELDWTVVRPGAYTDGPLTGRYRHGFGPGDRAKLKISRADVAHFVLRQLDDATYLRSAVSVSY